MVTADAVVIGGGMAGISVAHELSALGIGAVVVEMEPTLAYHTTGRSAAQYLINYGNDVVRRLTLASADFFAHATDEPLWSPRTFMRLGRAEHAAVLRVEAEAARVLAPSTRFLDGDEARRLVPVLRPDVAGALFEPDAMELDVAAIHQTFVRGLRTSGGEIRTSSPVVALQRDDGWSIELADGTTISAPIVVNASGAWGDRVAAMAGAEPLGLHPLRRSVAIVALPDGIDASGWPLMGFEDGDGAMDGYCKPEPGGLLVSPADETPSEPCDAKPEEIDIARGLEGLAAWTTLEVRHVRSTWAGLRTFAADRSPVAGFAADAPGFFWLVGQGGYGIQLSPGLARAAAALITEGGLPADLAAAGLSPADLAPGRPGLTGALAPDH